MVLGAIRRVSAAVGGGELMRRMDILLQTCNMEYFQRAHPQTNNLSVRVDTYAYRRMSVYLYVCGVFD